MATLNSLSLLCLLILLLKHPPVVTKADGEKGLTGAFAPPPSAPRSSTGMLPIVGILTTIFSITFLLLVYMKHCKRSTYANNSYPHPSSSRRNSGVDRKVIGALPMFRFSSLRGQKDGLECAVCLSKFSADEVLRLLPKCKHAFHVECIDTWLEAHSTCPLCRYRVDPEDVLLVLISTESANPRISGRHSSAGERATSLQIIAQNPARASLDSWKSFRKKTGTEPSRKDGELPLQAEKRRLEHRIILSAGEEDGRRRWSDVEAAELLYLGSEMLLGKSGRGVINGRSVSEITGMSRYRTNNGGKEERERLVKRWLAWISQSQHHQFPAVHSSSSSSILL